MSRSMTPAISAADSVVVSHVHSWTGRKKRALDHTLDRAGCVADKVTRRSWSIFHENTVSALVVHVYSIQTFKQL